MKTLYDIATALDIEPLPHYATLTPTALAWDSRTIPDHSLFIAVAGLNYDPHDDLPSLAASGKILAALVEREISLSIPTLVIPDLAEREGEIAALCYDYPARQMRVVGVTGTNGKSSTVTYLAQIYHALGKRAAVLGTLGYAVWPEPLTPLSNTTPRGAELQTLFNTSIAEGVDYLFMEVSSHALELGRVQGTQFFGALFTNLTPDHLDFHGTMENYLAAKWRLFTEYSPAIALVNRERVPLSATQWHTVASYGTNGSWRVENQIMDEQGIAFQMQGHHFRAPLYGPFNLENIQAAVAFALADGYAPAEIAEALTTLQPPAGRFQVVAVNSIRAIIDYAHTPDALERLLHGARALCTGRLIVVFGCGGDRDTTKRPKMGALASQLADIALVTDDNPRTENPDQIIAQIIAPMDPAKTETIRDRATAIQRACELAGEDDLLVIAGKGHEEYQIYGRERIHFSDLETFQKTAQMAKITSSKP